MTDPINVVLRARRKALRLSQSALAARLGIQQSGLSDLENGHREPRYSTLRCWADALGYDVADFQLLDRGAS